MVLGASVEMDTKLSHRSHSSDHNLEHGGCQPTHGGPFPSPFPFPFPLPPSSLSILSPWSRGALCESCGCGKLPDCKDVFRWRSGENPSSHCWVVTPKEEKTERILKHKTSPSLSSKMAPSNSDNLRTDTETDREQNSLSFRCEEWLEV